MSKTTKSSSVIIPGYDTRTPVLIRTIEDGTYSCEYQPAAWARSDVPDAEKSATGSGDTEVAAKAEFVRDAIRRLRAN